MFSWESSNGKKRETINDLSSLEAEEATPKLPFQTYNLTKSFMCVLLVSDGFHPVSEEAAQIGQEAENMHELIVL